MPKTIQKTKPADKTATNDTKQPSLIAENTKFSLTLPWAEIKAAYQSVLGESSKTVKTAGFRKGHVPTHMAETLLGKEKLIEKALQKILPKHFSEAVKKLDKHPLTQPDFKPVSTDWEKDWEIEVQIAERPTIMLGDYKKIIKAAKKQAITDHEAHHKTEATKSKTPAKEKTKEEQEHEVEHERQFKLETIFRDLVTTIKPSIPELLLREQTRTEIRRIADSLARYKLSIEEYLKKQNQSVEEFTQQTAGVALGQLQLEFILQTIAEAEKLDISDNEIAAELKKLPEQPPADMQSYYEDSIKAQLLKRKIYSYLLDL